MKINKNNHPPKGLSKTLFRVPVYAYRAGLGWIFGERLVLLRHTGRVSGKPRQAVLEVVDHDPADDSFVVVSGWGTTAAWYRNVMHTPDVTIQVGRRDIPVRAVKLNEEEGAQIFANYAARHRMATKYLLPRLLGYSVDGSEADFRDVGQQPPFIRFVPR